jgi:prophage tail gpP-like protein
MSNQVIVKIDGVEWVGWTSVQVTRSIDKAASSFTISVAPHPLNEKSPLEVYPGSSVKIFYGKTLVLSGSVDNFDIDFDRESHQHSFTGRSKTKDLIDCSALNSKAFKKQTIKQIASDLAAPYNVQVKGEAEDTIESFQVNQDGESPFEAIQRLAEKRELLITDTPEGHLLITNKSSGKSRNEIRMSHNENTKVLRGRFTNNESERFHEVIVKGQYKSSDEAYGKKTSQVEATHIDPEVRSTRKKILVADTSLDQGDAIKKARYQSQGNASKGVELTLDVQDWYGSAGDLWQPNQLVRVTIPICGIDAVFLMLSEVNFKIDENGTICSLKFNPKEAYQKDPKPENKPKSKAKKKIAKSVSTFWKDGDPL